MKKKGMLKIGSLYVMYFWPLLIAAGRVATRIVLNLWDMIES